MARVIKAGGGNEAQHERAAPRQVVAQAGKRPVIEKDLYEAQLRAAEIRRAAEREREQVLEEGKRRAAQLREEAQSEGAAEAFAAAAAETLAAFRRRAERFGEASDDVRVLAREVVRKVLGVPTLLPQERVEAILAEGMKQLRARRKLRVQLGEARLSALAHERPALLHALRAEPDILLEPVTDVRSGYCRIVTEVGGALCSEKAALETLAEGLHVVEVPRAKEPPRGGALAHPPISEDDDDDEPTLHRRVGGHLQRPASRSGRPTVGSAPFHRAHPAAGGPAAVPRAEPHKVGGQLRPARAAEADPEATMHLDVQDLREELERGLPPGANRGGAASNDEDLELDDLDLHVDEVLRRR
ncbi:MAG: hypothetical protein ACO3JL_02070 [Myxococcota bacterium]